jgi:hypothetical protein
MDPALSPYPAPESRVLTEQNGTEDFSSLDGSFDDPDSGRKVRVPEESAARLLELAEGVPQIGTLLRRKGFGRNKKFTFIDTKSWN